MAQLLVTDMSGLRSASDVVLTASGGAVGRRVLHRHRLIRRLGEGHHEVGQHTGGVLVEVELQRLEVDQLVLVDGVPVVGQDAAGVGRVGVPRPERPGHVLRAGGDVDGAVVVEVTRQVRRDRLVPDDVLRIGEPGAELTQIDRGDVLLVDVAPHLLELVGQRVPEIGALEPGLGIDRVRIVVRRIHDPVVLWHMILGK